MWIMVDVETDGPAPGLGLYSMVSLGAVVVEPGLERTFYAQFYPISNRYVEEALAVSGHTRAECEAFPPAVYGMEKFAAWLKQVSPHRPMFISDNNGFDWQFVNYYFHRYLEHNPFGFSSTNLGSLYKGLVKNGKKSFKHLRKTPHTHHPVDDARGNAEALLTMISEHGLRWDL
jgi:hypothetical protein